MLSLNRIGVTFIAIILCLVVLVHFKSLGSTYSFPAPSAAPTGIYRIPAKTDPNKFDWSQRSEQYPVTSYHPLPPPSAGELPKVQYDFASGEESRVDAATRRQRMAQVKGALKRCWTAYRLKAWMEDELAPVSGGNRTTFGGWAATMVDTLDTLWIMDMKTEFYEAVDSVVLIDFSAANMETVNVFETTIRYLGGFVSAYDLSGDKRLLDKALELADMLYAAFDTPNRMPILRWNFHAAVRGQQQEAVGDVILSEIGSLSLEFTRLSQITNDPKWYDAIARIMDIFEAHQHESALPGLWPIQVNAKDADFHSGYLFTLAAWADSMYEYLLKMHVLLGGSDKYAKMHESAMTTAIQHALYRPMIKENKTDVLMVGAVRVQNGEVAVQPELQHLACYTGGMFALGGKLLKNETHIDIGRQLTNGCVWAYEVSKNGIMPETSNLIPCASKYERCEFDIPKWVDAVYRDASAEDKANNTKASDIIKRQRLPPGFSAITNPRYLLRPEAIESVFILYRITGNKELQETAWTMFRSIYTRTRTDMANSAILDVTNTTLTAMDSMESFWTAETLKYFYLTFSDPDYISLDDYVFNTEAHPFKQPGITPKKSDGWSLKQR